MFVLMSSCLCPYVAAMLVCCVFHTGDIKMLLLHLHVLAVTSFTCITVCQGGGGGTLDFSDGDDQMEAKIKTTKLP